MSIADRFKQLGLPADECVVTSGGVLDALGIRPTDDIDIVVSDRLYRELEGSGDWQTVEGKSYRALAKGDAEVSPDWGSEPEHQFEALFADSVEIQGVRFANPRTVLKWKQSRNRAKDQADILSLTEYLQNE